MPEQYQFKKYKNCFVLIQLHLILKIFVCDAWLALWIFFVNFCSTIFGTTLQDWNSLLNNLSLMNRLYKKNSLFISSTSVAIRECWSRVIVIGYQTDNLKAETYSANHYLRKWFVFEFWFPSRIVSALPYATMTSWEIERVINKNYKKNVEEFNCRY